MRLSRRLFQILFALGLSLLVATALILKLPQTALSQTQSSIASILAPPRESQKLARRTTFPDITGHWAQNYIEALAVKDILVGYLDGRYYPDNIVTRAEFAAIINKAFNPSPKRSSINFIDLDKKYWGKKAIQTAYRGRFLEGYPDNTFKPKDQISRVEVLVSLVTGLDLHPPKDTESVVSVYQNYAVPPYAANAVAAATEQRLVVLDPSQGLNLDKQATRAEVAAFIYQALTKAGKAQPLSPNFPGVVIEPGAKLIISPGNPPATPAPNPAPSSTPFPSQPPSSPPPSSGNPPATVPESNSILPSTQSGKPNGLVVTILNFSKVDGQSFKVGDPPIKIVATAKDDDETDLSQSIVWRDSVGQELGKGSELNYPTVSVGILTLTAYATSPKGKQNFASVTVSISPQNQETPSHIKPLGHVSYDPQVLGDGPQKLITDIDLRDPGRVCFSGDSESWQKMGYPTIQVGDVILGAGETIPPLKVLRILNSQSNQACVETTFAPIESFFPKTSKPFVINKLIPESQREIKYNDDKKEWSKINLEAANADANSPDTGNIAPRNDKSPKLSSKWPSYVSECIYDNYLNRLNQLQKIDTSFSKGGNANKTYPIDRLPSPEKIIPPEDRQYVYDLKEKLEEYQKRNQKERKTAYQQKSKTDSENAGNFKTAKVERTEKLDLNAYFGFNVTPKLVPPVDFDPSNLSFDELKKLGQSLIGYIGNDFVLSADVKIDETIMGGIAINGLYDLLYQDEIKIPTGLDGLAAPRVAFVIPPGIPVWIDFPLLFSMNFEAGLEASYKEGTIGFLQNGYGDFTVNYSAANGSTGVSDVDFDSIVATNFCGKPNLQGNARISIKPRVQVLLYSLIGPELGLEPYLNLKLERPTPVMSIKEQGVVGNEVKLRANMDETLNIPVKLKAATDYVTTGVTVNEAVMPIVNRGIGKKCILKKETVAGKAVAWASREITGKEVELCIGPFEIKFDPNRWFRDKLSSQKELLSSNKQDLDIDIPIASLFTKSLESLFKDDTIVWTADKVGTLGVSNPGSDLTINKCSLPVGINTVTANAYPPFAAVSGSPSSSSNLQIEVKPEECSNK
jgi:hypothetical protein